MLSWHERLAAVDEARRLERNGGFRLDLRLATIEAEIRERQAFAQHLRDKIMIRDMLPGSSFEAGLR
jgi:hypothetical protein